jgi:hypothetical protein
MSEVARLARRRITQEIIMGNNIESGDGSAKVRTPLYSNGTPEMDGHENVGAVEGPKKGVTDADLSGATQFSPGK